jgi:hypothetical protein
MTNTRSLSARIVGACQRFWKTSLRRIGAEGGWPPVGWVTWGTFRRTTPVNRAFGFHRGQPIDRHFIEDFLQSHAEDIQGRVLEVGDRGYTLAYGGGRVTQSDVLHAIAGNTLATIVGRLDTGDGIPSDAFDCAILTQTLHVIYDIHSAVQNIQGMLKPGGVALVTIPCISQISPYDAAQWGDYWRLTPAAAQQLFAEAFPSGSVEITFHGNVMLAVALLQGLVVEDLPERALQKDDPQYPLLICVRAVRER